MLTNVDVSNEIVRELTNGTEVLRVGFNMGNALLVTGKTATGEPLGVARDMAENIAKALGVRLKCVPFARPGQVADAADSNVWDICLIGAEPARAEKIAFTSAYVEIRARYLVRGDSPLKAVADVDRPGIRIIIKSGSAYELWLTRNIKHAAISRVTPADEVLRLFMEENYDVLAGLEEQLVLYLDKVPGGRMLDGMFTSVQQAIGTHKMNVSATRFLETFVANAITSGLVSELITKHKMKGLAVAGK